MALRLQYFLLYLLLFVNCSLCVLAADEVPCDKAYAAISKDIAPTVATKSLSPSIFLRNLQDQFAQQTQTIPITVDGITKSIPKAEAIAKLSKYPGLQWIKDIVLQDQVSFIMNRGKDSREGILAKGFENQYQAGKSAGSFEPAAREAEEAKLLGMPTDQYKSIPAELRAKYGYLGPQLGTALKRNSSARNYGTDVYYFKKNKLSQRTTYYPGDSLDEFGSNLGSDNADFVKPWARMFSPWKEKGLLLLHMANEVGAPLYKNELSIQDVGYGAIDLDTHTQIIRGMIVTADYVELQFWGKLTLDDVETFAFEDAPPTGAFLKALRDRKIKIYKTSADGTMTPWNG